MKKKFLNTKSQNKYIYKKKKKQENQNTNLSKNPKISHNAKYIMKRISN